MPESDYTIIHAYSVDEYQIRYRCPFCYKISSGRILDSPFCKRTKRLYSSAKHCIHIHGSGGNLENRTEIRASHCTINRDKEIKIIIDDKTKRIR